MADARRMGKMELFAHFADKFDMKRTAVRDLFEELLRLSEKELKRSGEFVIPGVCKLVVQRRDSREDRRQGPDREGPQRRGPAPQVVLFFRRSLADGALSLSVSERSLALSA